MTDQEFFEKSLEVSTEFDRFILAHPEIAEKIPRGPNGEEALIVFELEDDPEFSRKSIEIARETRSPNQPIVVVKAKKLLPANETRLIEPELEIASRI